LSFRHIRLLSDKNHAIDYVAVTTAAPGIERGIIPNDDDDPGPLGSRAYVELAVLHDEDSSSCCGSHKLQTRLGRVEPGAVHPDNLGGSLGRHRYIREYGTGRVGRHTRHGKQRGSHAIELG